MITAISSNSSKKVYLKRIIGDDFIWDVDTINFYQEEFNFSRTAVTGKKAQCYESKENENCLAILQCFILLSNYSKIKQSQISSLLKEDFECIKKSYIYNSTSDLLISILWPNSWRLLLQVGITIKESSIILNSYGILFMSTIEFEKHNVSEYSLAHLPVTNSTGSNSLLQHVNKNPKLKRNMRQLFVFMVLRVVDNYCWG